MYAYHISFKKKIAVSLKGNSQIYISSHQYTVLLHVTLFLLLLANKAQATSDQCVILTPPQEKWAMKSLGTLFANKAPCDIGTPIVGGLIVNGLIPIAEYCNKTSGLFLPYTPYTRVSEIFDKRMYILPASIARNLDCIDTKNNLFSTWGIGGVPHEVSSSYPVLLHLIYNIQKFKDIFKNMLGISFVNCINHIKTIEREIWILDPILEKYEAENCSNWFLNERKSSNTTQFNITQFNTTQFNTTQFTKPDDTSTTVSNVTAALLFNISSTIAEFYNQTNISYTQNPESAPLETTISNQSVGYNTSNHSHNQPVSLADEKENNRLILGLAIGLGIPSAILLIYFLSRQIIRQSKKELNLERIDNLATEKMDESKMIKASTAIAKTAQKINEQRINPEERNLFKMQCLLCLGMAILENTDDPAKTNKEKTLLTLFQTLENGIEYGTPLPDSIEDPFLLTGEEDLKTRELKTNVNALWHESMAEYKGKGPSEKKENLDQFIQTFNEVIEKKIISEKLETIISDLQPDIQPSHGYPV